MVVMADLTVHAHAESMYGYFVCESTCMVQITLSRWSLEDLWTVQRRLDLRTFDAVKTCGLYRGVKT